MLSALCPARVCCLLRRCLLLVLLLAPLRFAAPVSAQTSQTQLLAISCGSGAASPFVADTDYTGGNAYSYGTGTAVNTSGVSNPAPQSVYQSERWGNSTYVLPGFTHGTTYSVRLHFAELSCSSPNQRIFNVAINGTQVLTNFDIFAAAGGANIAIVRAFPATADANGNITVAFTNGSVNNAKISGIEVLTASVLAPYGGSAVNIASTGTTKVEAENYDKGGEGIAYHDVSNGGQTAYRTDNIGVYSGSNNSNGYAVGWTVSGEWDGYTINIAKAGVYVPTAAVGNTSSGGMFHLEFGPVGQVGGTGVVTSAEFTSANTTNSNPYCQPVSVAGVSLPAGPLWMRVVIDSPSPGNFDDFTLTAVPTLTSIAVSPASASLSPNATQQFTAVANDQNGNALSPQPTFAWSSTGVGTIGGSTGLYTAGTTAGSATVKAASGSVSGTATATVNAPPQPTPYGGSAVTVGSSGTTKVESENYDLGGEGVAYHDITNGGYTAYRSDNIGVEPGSVSNGYDVTYTANGEWDGYTLSVASAGAYTLSAAMSSPTAGGMFHLEFGPVGQVGGSGITQSGEFTVPNTGSYSTFQSVSMPGIRLPAGPLWMRLVIDSQYPCKFDYFTLTAVAVPTGLTATAGNTSIALGWTAPAGTITSYNVKRGTASGGPYTTISTTGAVTATSYTDATAVSGTTYYYVVSAVSASGESGNSNQASASLNSATAGATNLTVNTYGSSTSLYLFWNGASQSDTFNIYRSTTPGGEGSVPIKTGVVYDSGAYDDNNPGYQYVDAVPAGSPAGTTYYYQVTEVSRAVEGAKSNEASATPGVAALPAPTLTAGPSSGQIILNWSAVASASSYNIYRYVTGTYSSSSTLYKLGVTATTYPDTGVTNGTNYTYYVTAVNKNGEGTQSNSVTATPGGATAAATNLTARPYGSTGAYLNWNGVSTSDTFNIYRSTTPGGEGAVPINKTPVPYDSGGDGGNAFDFYDSGLSATTTYYYQVTEVTKAGEGPKSNEASTTPGVTALAGPILKAVPSSGQIILNWSAVSSATSYNIYRYATGTYSGNSLLYQLGVTATTYTDFNVTVGTNYTYYVTAVDKDGEGNPSSSVTATPGGATAAATNLTAHPNSGYVYLVWNGVNQSDTFNIYRSTSSGGEGAVPIRTGVQSDYNGDSGNNFDYSDAVPANSPAGTTYYYQVTEVNKAGEGPKSNEASATPGGNAPAAPTGLTATPGSGQVVLNWGTVSGATSYNIYRYITKNPFYGSSALYRLGVAGPSYTDTGVTNGTGYTYYVTAVSAAGESNPSNSVTAIPGGATVAATNLTASTSGSSTSVFLNWIGASQLDTFNLYRSTSPGGEGATPIKTGIVYDNGYNDDNNAGFQYVDTAPAGSPAGMTYYYQVTEVNAAGEGPKSNEASATPGKALLAAPTLTATPDPNGGASITLAWNSVTGATSYNIYRYVTSTYDPVPYKVGVTGTSFVDTGVSYGVSYSYYVAAVSKDGEGAKSSTVITTLKGFGLSVAPATLTILRGTMQAVTVSVTPSGGYTAPVLLSGTNLPAGVSAWFYPGSVFLPTVNMNSSGQVAEYQAGFPSEGINGTVSSGLYLAVAANAVPGTYTLNISGASSNFTSGTTVTVTIQ